MDWTAEIDGYATALRAAGRSPGTVRLRRSYLLRLSVHAGGDPWAVRLEQLQQFLAAGCWSPETANSARSTVRGFYGWGVTVGRIDRSPALGLDRVKVPTPSPRPAPDHVLARALLAAGERETLMLRLAAWQGLRRAEIARVHSGDVNDGLLRVKGKGGKVRLLPLDRRLELQIVAAGGWVFPSRRGGHLSADRVGQLMRGLLGGEWTAHTLRHRFASRAYAAERDFRAVQELLGHSSMVTTQRYVAVPSGALAAAVRAAAA